MPLLLFQKERGQSQRLSLSTLTSLRIPEESPRDRRLSRLRAGTAAETVTSRLALGDRLHVRCSLCLRGDADADADKDGAMNFLPARRRGAGSGAAGAGSGRSVFLRSEFIKDSSNVHELRVSSL